MERIYEDIVMRLYGRAATANGDATPFTNHFGTAADDKALARRFMLYQFSCFQHNVSAGKVVPYSTIMSKKSIERWGRRSQNYEYYVNKWLTDINIDPGYARVKLLPDNHLRKRHYNTEKGLYACLMGGVSFKATEPLCADCISKKECRKYGKIPINQRSTLFS